MIGKSMTPWGGYTSAFGRGMELVCVASLEGFGGRRGGSSGSTAAVVVNGDNDDDDQTRDLVGSLCTSTVAHWFGLQGKRIVNSCTWI